MTNQQSPRPSESRKFTFLQHVRRAVNFEQAAWDDALYDCRAEVIRLKGELEVSGARLRHHQAMEARALGIGDSLRSELSLLRGAATKVATSYGTPYEARAIELLWDVLNGKPSIRERPNE